MIRSGANAINLFLPYLTIIHINLESLSQAGLSRQAKSKCLWVEKGVDLIHVFWRKFTHTDHAKNASNIFCIEMQRLQKISIFTPKRFAIDLIVELMKGVALG
jgi:hypothetical protein